MKTQPGGWLLLLVTIVVLGSTACREPAAFPGAVVVRGHEELQLGFGPSPLPKFIGPGSAGLCLAAPSVADTSHWRAAVDLGGHPLTTTPVPPKIRLANVLCFAARLPAQLPAQLPADSHVELCGRLVDGYDGKAWRLPCRSVVVVVDRSPLEHLHERQVELLADRQELGLDRFLRQLDQLAEQARTREMPMFAARLQLVAAHFLRQDGTADSRQQAAQRIASLDRLQGESVTSFRALVLHEKARLVWSPAYPAGSQVEAWQTLAEAQRLATAVASPHHLAIRVAQAALLSHRGAGEGAVEALRVGLEDCAVTGCSSRAVTAARSQMAWLISLLPTPTDEELAEAEEQLGRVLAGSAHLYEESVEATALLNLAYLRLRQGRQPRLVLDRARQALRERSSGRARSRLLQDWADLIEGLAALAEGDLQAATSFCRQVAGRANPEISTWGLSCAARAARLSGDRGSALTMFGRILERHEIALERQPGDGLEWGSSALAADDFARAARLAVELGELDRAWDFLSRLDVLDSRKKGPQHCREQAQQTRHAEQQIDREIARLYEALKAAEQPGSGARERALAPVRRELRAELRQLTRTQPGCAPVKAPAHGTGYRAFALVDEVLVLHRDPRGAVSLVRRTPFDRRELARRLRRVRQASNSPATTDPAWRALLEPVARALLPADLDRLGEVTRFSLYGLLQEVPIAALPLPQDSPGGAQWLAELTAPALVPVAAAVAIDPPGSPTTPLWVLDPAENLPQRSQSSRLALQFAGGRVLAGRAATRAAFSRSLASTSWLHVDAHGHYEEAFPELSGLALSDGVLPLIELARLPIPQRFANLSGCHTGRWPTTAASGRFGLAGEWVRRGTPWVVASLDTLPDELASRFNHAFYRAIAEQATVPRAYAEGLRAAAERFPASSWATLVLVSSAAESAGGSPEG